MEGTGSRSTDSFFVTDLFVPLVAVSPIFSSLGSRSPPLGISVLNLRSGSYAEFFVIVARFISLSFARAFSVAPSHQDHVRSLCIASLFLSFLSLSLFLSVLLAPRLVER